MTKPNYSAWIIDQQKFSDDWTDKEKLLFFAKYAVLAPSGHNTQPWKVQVSNDALYLKYNHDRDLPLSGKRAAEPFVSIGSFTETFVLAGKAFGYSIDVLESDEKDVAAILKLSDVTKRQVSLASAITQRTSNRNPYDITTELDQTTIQRIVDNPFEDCEIFVTQSKKDIAFLAEQTSQATITIMREPAFRKELSKWVRNNKTGQYDGMPGFVQGIPTPPSFLAKYVVRHLDISKTQAKTDARRVLVSPAVIILQAKEPTPQAFTHIGRLYARVCILAQELGLATSGVGAAAIDPTTKQNVKEYFNLAYQPTAMIRIGKASAPAPHAPRHTLEQILE
jgi:hypothetical protein